ncbi:MAG: HigA family addiction module antidote protein [Planctomycetaceae bacterium]|nr:HigA family addiction module antidote protein [Planctomycetaceae bacterium]
MTNTSPKPIHPGKYVRDQVIPAGMSVKKAAETMGIGRPALSNFLNGSAALSPEMAARLQKAFGASPKELMKLQSDCDALQTDDATIARSTRKFVPPFLRAKANDIEKWADSISSRTKLSVFLRTLVHSTCGGLSVVDFPGNDDAERPGWDGMIETSEGNPWIPIGLSGWEFGTNKDIPTKANKDYTKSVKSVPKAERQNMTFVFVTPRRWPGKEKWREEKHTEGEWKAVTVLDSGDLEQWLEQSIAAQVWFADEQGQNFRGTQSLDACWVHWNADCEPAFTTQIFDEAAITAGRTLISHFEKSPERTLRIAADSRQEGLAFLHCILTEDDHDLKKIRDRIVVFNEPGPLAEIVTNSTAFIPVITDREVEKELSQSGNKLGGIVIGPRTMMQTDADIMLDSLSGSAFEKALSSMGLGREETNRLSNESGKSLTVLRRRLAQSEAIRSPDWSSDERVARSLFPFMLAGAWKADKEADQLILCHLAGCNDYEELEKQYSHLNQVESPPVWAVGTFRGIVSKVDALYAVHQWVTPDQLKRFGEAAELVLSERDPTLDLPEKDRWAADIYGKSREISTALRDGLADSLVLLAIHGSKLFRKCIGVDPEVMATLIVRKLFDPLTEDTLESQSSDFPLYAEAAPEEFLSILERDLGSDEPLLKVLMRPTDSGIFGSTPRVGLLWALEALAWSPEYITRVIEILAQLTEMEADDNWANKPSATLESIFRSWMPQTGAPLKQRISLIDWLVKHYPSIAWSVGEKQYQVGSRVGDHANKPKWRDYAFGYGEPVTNGESWEFIDHCTEVAITWSQHTRETLGDLVSNNESFSDKNQERIWHAIAEWSKTAIDEDRAWLRERIRTTTTRNLRQRKSSKKADEASSARIRKARECYENLEPQDIVWKHAWLFKNGWVDESWDEIQSDDMDFKSRDERIAKKRLNALEETLKSEGLDAILRLGLSGDAPHVAGDGMASCLFDSVEQLKFVEAVLADGDILMSRSHQSILDGFFIRLGEERALELVEFLWQDLSVDEGVKLLCLCRFAMPVWKRVEILGDEVVHKYWNSVAAHWGRQSEEELHYGISKLLSAKRALSALHLVHLDLKNVESEQLYSILKELPNSVEEHTGANQMDAYTIKKAFKLLNERKAFPRGKMAQLEFLYLDLFQRDEGGIPNLEQEIGDNPSLFCEAIIFAYKREDREKGEELTDEQKTIAGNAYKLLSTLSQIPGKDKDGSVSKEKLENWITKARELCRAQGRLSMCDYQIGELLTHAPIGDDGVWPCEPVKTVIDRLLNKRMGEGIHIGRRNSRGAHWRGEGGGQERELADQYEGWAKACDYSHPRLASVLRELAESYLREADWQDDEAVVRKRLRY